MARKSKKVEAVETKAEVVVDTEVVATDACAAGECEHRFKLAITFEALVKTEDEAKQIGEMFATLGLVIRHTGVPTRLEGVIYTKPGDDGRETPAPKRELN